MTTTAELDRSERSTATRVAQVLTEIFAPVVLIVALLFVVSLHSADSTAQGVLLGAIASFFVGILPYSVLLYGIRRGRLGDRHLKNRSERPLMMVLGLVSAVVGLLIVRGLGAPRDLFALLGAMVAGIVVALSITVFWKISIHCACVAGSVGVLTVLLGPIALVLLPAPLLTAWARVHLRDHTTAQAAAGLIVGAVVAVVAFTALRG